MGMETSSVADRKNLADGSLTLTADPSKPTSVYSFHAPEKDTEVEITLSAGAGQTGERGAAGGQGGQSTFRVTLQAKHGIYFKTRIC